MKSEGATSAIDIRGNKHRPEVQYEKQMNALKTDNEGL